MTKTTLENGLTLELDSNNFTAHIIESPKTKGNLIIPRSVVFQSKEYDITSIKKYSFLHNKKIRSIDFAERSSLLLIEEKSFKFSSIKVLHIPSSVEELQEGWCDTTPKLNEVIISPNNPNFKYIDEKQNSIIGKSDKNKEKFDVFIFGCRNIKEVTIPSYIKHISSYSLHLCTSLTKMTISEDSELLSFGKKIISDSQIGSLYIPDKFESFQVGWCHIIGKLNEVNISPKNPNFKYLDEGRKIIVGKSDKQQEKFDVVLFACRDIEDVTIPSYIKRLNSFSFQCCKKLKSISFSENSQLRTVGKSSFF